MMRGCLRKIKFSPLGSEVGKVKSSKSENTMHDKVVRASEYRDSDCPYFGHGGIIVNHHACRSTKVMHKLKIGDVQRRRGIGGGLEGLSG